MKDPNRKKKTFKLKSPIVYETEEGCSEIHEFEVWEPRAGQIKNLGSVAGLNYSQMIDLTAECSEMTVPMLDLMTFEDMNRLMECLVVFLSGGRKLSELDL